MNKITGRIRESADGLRKRTKAQLKEAQQGVAREAAAQRAAKNEQKSGGERGHRS